MNIGTRIVWHSYRVKSAVVFRTSIPIFIFLMVQRRTKKEIPAITKAIIAMVLRSYGSWKLSKPLIWIFPSAVSKHTTPKVMISTKYNTMTDITKHPPHALMKNINPTDKRNVIKIIDKEIGHVCWRSAIASSKKPSPRSIVSAIYVLTG